MCLGTNVSRHKRVRAQTRPHDYNMSGHKCVWAQSCLGTNVCEHNRVWVQTCLGTIVSWHNRVWAQSCLGTIVSGHNRVWTQSCLGTIVWAQSCGFKYVWAQSCGLPSDYMVAQLLSYPTQPTEQNPGDCCCTIKLI